MTARSALGKVYCGRKGCRGELPSPALDKNGQRRYAPYHGAGLDAQLIFALDGWRVRDDVECRVGRHRGNRSTQRIRHNTEVVEAGAATVWGLDGERLKALPFKAQCPRCQTVNVIDNSLLALLG